MMSAQSDHPAGSIIETLRADHQRAIEAVRRDGYVLIPDVLTAQECDYYSGLQLALAKKSKTYIGGYLRESDIMEKEFGFSKLLDHPDTYPIAKALLGGFARIMSTEAIIRTDADDDPVRWHEDGPNCPPYRSLATPAPTCQVKIGYFLNDLLTEDAGNLVVMPRSHLLPHGPPSDLPRAGLAEGALQVKAKAGTAIIFHSALWHCVAPNKTKTPRKSLYYGYCLPWMAPFDRQASSLALKSLLTGERRQLLMDFEHPGTNYVLIKETWRGDPKLAVASPFRMGYELAVRRLKKLKRAILGTSIN
jgi:ectoine hydroxylase